MKTVLWSMLCLFLSGWGSMQTVSAQDLQEMEKNLSAINEELSQKTKEYSWQLAAAYADYCEANNKYISWNDLPYLQQVVEYERPASLETYRLEHKANKEELDKFLNTYNNKYHSTIKCTPQEMFNDHNLEKEYILKCMDKTENQKKIHNIVLPIGSYVRVILPRHNGITKKRNQVSKECYKIDSRNGHMYTLIAKDGSVVTRPRFKLLPCNIDDAKFANTIPGKWNGNVEKILEYYPKKRKYKVQFVIPGEEPYIDIIPASYLRGAVPTRMSKLEKEFFNA